MTINFGEDKDILVEELEGFHDAILVDNVCINKLFGFKQYIERIFTKYSKEVENE